MDTQKAVVMSIAAVAAIGIGAAAATLTTHRDFNKAETTTASQNNSSAYGASTDTTANLSGPLSEGGEVLYTFDYTGTDESDTAAQESTSKKKSIFSRKSDDEAAETTLKSNTGSADTTAKPNSSSAATTAKADAKVADYEYAYAGFNPNVADTSGDWNLLLVNRDYILPDSYEVNLSAAVSGSDVRLDSRVSPYYQKMYNAAKNDGIVLTPVSGYRSISRQRTNFENKIQVYRNEGYSKAEATQMAAKRILPPGTSEHNAGLAMDICVASVDAHFENSEEYAWLEANAADYGFILRYPKDKQNITNITYEPWHWRYVGVTAAKAMKASGQCLEEYLGY